MFDAAQLPFCSCSLFSLFSSSVSWLLFYPASANCITNPTLKRVVEMLEGNATRIFYSLYFEHE